VLLLLVAPAPVAWALHSLPWRPAQHQAGSCWPLMPLQRHLSWTCCPAPRAPTECITHLTFSLPQGLAQGRGQGLGACLNQVSVMCSNTWQRQMPLR
jgi:hypothetical protein